MDYNKATGLRTIAAFVCIAMVLMETVTAAPLLESNNTETQSVRRTRSTKPLRKKMGNVHGKSQRWASILNESDWSNSCHSYSYVEITSEMSGAVAATATAIITEPTEVKNVIWDLNQTLSRFHAENTSQWEKFHGGNYTFLPTRPGHDPYRWHDQTQVIVASLSVILHMQEKKDKEANNETISGEIRDIFAQAQELLCQIEHFINRTANTHQTRKLSWISKETMAGKIKSLPKKNQRISNAFVKERFTQFLEKLYKNVKNYNPDMTPETRQQKNKRRRTRLPSRRPNCTPRPGKRCRKKRTTVEPNAEPTKPMVILRTKKPRVNRQRKNKTIE